MADKSLLRRSFSQQQRSNRFKNRNRPKKKSSGGGGGGLLLSAFQVYLPFRSKEEEPTKSQIKFDAFRSADNEDESEGQRLESMPSNSSNMESQDKDNQMANEEGGECGVVAMAVGSSSNGSGSGSGKGSKGNRFKRNIKNTRSLIVRKFTSTNSSSNSNSNSNTAEKKPSETNNKTSTSKHSSEMAEQHANANVMDNDKPNTKQKKVAMLRTTTL